MNKRTHSKTIYRFGETYKHKHNMGQCQQLKTLYMVIFCELLVYKDLGLNPDY